MNHDWISLFDGYSLDGWEAATQSESFKVQDGSICCTAPRAYLYYTGVVEKSSFKNFELSAEIRCSQGGRASIYFHTQAEHSAPPRKGYRVLVNNNLLVNGHRELCKTGSLYRIRNRFDQLVRDEELFNLRIIVTGKRIRVRVNDVEVVDYCEPTHPVRIPELRERVLSAGTFALESLEGSVSFNDLRLRLLPEASSEPVEEASSVDERYQQLMDLQMKTFPLIDLHVHLKGLTLDEALASSLRTGINYGIAPNCGLIHEGLPGVVASTFIRDDAGLDRFRESMQGKPVFLGMQAEGREWVGLFSPEAMNKYDYVFTDCLTFIDQRGKRVRLWIDEEVHIDDAQDFMEMYVEKIVAVIENEPFDIFVNPTFLPSCIADRYDELWTAERMDRVIQAASRKPIALEINSGFRIPSADFIRRAKRAGVKFTFGTNNVDANLGRLEYCLDMIHACDLSTEDVFVPDRHG